MKISEVARRAGVTAHALRHYERLGLIAAARRPSGYRDYDETVVREVAFITAGRRLGFSLRALGEALPAYRDGRLTPSQGIESLNELIAEVDRQIAALQVRRATLVGHVARLQDKARAKKPTRRGAAWPSFRTPKEPR